jgi:hypothetical protein
MTSPVPSSRIALLGSCFGIVLLAAGGCGSSPATTSTGHGGTTGGGHGGTSASAGTTGSGGTTATTGTAGAGGTQASGTGTAGATGGAATAGTTGGGLKTGTGRNQYGTGGAGANAGCIPGGAQCNNCIDDDHDGLADYEDPECVGPLDNDEGSFATGINGDNMDACRQDCFFDGDSGMGNDHCLWQLKCDPLSTGGSCPYDAGYAASHQTECSTSASQSQQCIDSCRRLVPNGCDCFGCCAIPGGPTIRLAATCTAAKFNDPVACPRCTQVTQCANPCGHCEICIGKPTLPADCTASTPDGGATGGGGAGGSGPDSGTTSEPPQCDGENPIPCGPGTNTPANGCPVGQGCLTGCCFPIPG